MNQFELRPGREAKKHPSEMLRGMLLSLSLDINGKVLSEKLAGELLSPDGALNPMAYTDVYNQAELEADAKLAHELEIEFAKFYKDEPGIKTEDEMIARWKEDKSRQKSGQMEMSVTVLLSEMLGEKFLVVRTAPYDDYKNGVDNLIVNRDTGEVVGAFDEVHDSADGHRTDEKKAKIQKIAKNGGAEIKYGLGFKRGKLKRAHLEGVPVFYLGLEEGELGELVQGLNENDMAKKETIFKKLLASLSAQQKELLETSTSVPLRVKLKSFGETLASLEAKH